MKRKLSWGDMQYNKRTMARNRKRFFAYSSVVLYFLHGVIMVALLLLGLHKWAVVCEGTMIGYALLVLLTPDTIAKEVAEHPAYYGGFVMPAIYIVMVGLLI